MSPDLFDSVVLAIRWLVGTSLLVGGLENLAAGALYRSDGLLSWEVLSTQGGAIRNPVRRWVLDRLYGARGVRFLNTLLIVSVLLLAWPGLPVLACLLAAGTALLIRLLLANRCPYGMDGSDQMETMVLAGLVITFVLRQWAPEAAPWGLYFITGQCVLSYLASGVSKLASPIWRDGTAAMKVFGTYTYSAPSMALLMQRAPALGVPLCWSVMLWETAFPLALFLPQGGLLGFLAVGVVFHFMNAVVMGLNKFFWAFLATYPAVWYCHRLWS